MFLKLFTIITILLSINAQALEILKGSYIAIYKIIKLEVEYSGGGIEKHRFVLKDDGCPYESTPKSCMGTLVDLDAPNDPYESIQRQTVFIPMKDFLSKNPGGANFIIEHDKKTKNGREKAYFDLLIK